MELVEKVLQPAIKQAAELAVSKERAKARLEMADTIREAITREHVLPDPSATTPTPTTPRPIFPPASNPEVDVLSTKAWLVPKDVEGMSANEYALYNNLEVILREVRSLASNFDRVATAERRALRAPSAKASTMASTWEYGDDDFESDVPSLSAAMGKHVQSGGKLIKRQTKNTPNAVAGLFRVLHAGEETKEVGEAF